jgi:Dihaem cytochrome c
MTTKWKWLFALSAFLLQVNGCSSFSSADEHHDKKADRSVFDRNHHEDNDYNDRDKRRGRDDDDLLGSTTNSVYKGNCGACHFSYQPQLLPSGSWEKILSGLDDHFGETVDIDPDTRKGIRDYLLANGAERSSAKRAKKIVRSLGDKTPLRITEIPYIREKHHEISQGVFSRASIGSFSNCVACHITAENGMYDDDHVTIPR